MHADWQSLGVALAGLYEARRIAEQSATLVLAPITDDSPLLWNLASAARGASTVWEPSVPRRMRFRDLGRIRCRLR